MRTFVTLALLMSLVACSGVTDPARSLDVTFESALLESGSGGGPNTSLSPPEVEVDNGNLRVSGFLGTPTPCQTLRGELVMAGSSARVRITAVTRDASCFQVPASFSYHLESRLPAGATRVVVEHARVFRSQTQSLTVERDVVLTP